MLYGGYADAQAIVGAVDAFKDYRIECHIGLDQCCDVGQIRVFGLK
jgi:hypothetical protein